jgi:uncharacterized protein DUF4268
MVTPHERFWHQFRQLAAERGMTLYPHKPGKPWSRYRHVGRWHKPGGFAFVYHIRKDHSDASVEVHLGKGDIAGSNRVFDELAAHRPKIEASLGQPLVWDKKPNNDTSEIHYSLSGGGLPDEDQWPRIQSAMIDAMVRLEHTFTPLETRR